MQVRDNNMQLLFGLFQSICSWAFDEGVRDVAGMKNLLKLAMVDVSRKRHQGKSSIATQIAIATDLGISLRNVQCSLRELEEWKTNASSFVRIADIEKEIAIALLQEERSVNEILSEVSYLIHVPYDLQRKVLCSILTDLEERSIICKHVKNGVEFYKIVQPHASMYNPGYLAARITGLLIHLEAFYYANGLPYFRVFHMELHQVKEFQSAINEYLRERGDAAEKKSSGKKAEARPHYFYLGSALTWAANQELTIQDSLLQTIYARAKDVDSLSLMRTHCFKLTESKALEVFADVSKFIEETYSRLNKRGSNEKKASCTIHFGRSEKQPKSLNGEEQP